MKRTLVFLAGLVLLLMPWSEAMPYPDKPIKAIVGYEAGSAVDINARIFFRFMEKELGQPIAVVNKPGAAGSLGLKESGIDMVMNGWIAYVAPKGLPPEVSQKLIAASAMVANSKEYIEENAKTGSITTPECIGQEAVKFLDEDAAKQRPILEELGAAKDK